MKKTLTAVLACCAMLSRAQYLILPVAPPPQFAFGDLWQFTATRSLADNNKRFYVSLRIFDGQNRLKVKSNSAVFSLPVGTTYYNRSNLSPLQPFANSFTDAAILQQAIASGGFFPPGNYVLSYTLYGKGDDGDFTPLADELLSLTVESLWPPMLLSPPDGDTVPNPYPFLTWTPAFSSSLTGNIEYRLRLVELFNGQNAYQAIQANPAYFTQSGLSVTTLLYPPSAQALDTGKVYAWQVYADAGGASLGSSEVWTFSLATPKNRENTAPKKPFFMVSKILNSQAVEVSDGVLRLIFEEDLYDSDQRLKFCIVDNRRRTVADQSRLTRVVRKGHNEISISLCDNSNGFDLPKGYYTIEISSRRGEVYRLNFHHNKADTECGEQ